MRKLLSALLLLFLFQYSSFGQTKYPGHKGQGSLFAGTGTVAPHGGENIFHFGAGGEGLIFKKIGAGAEIGYGAPARYLKDGLGVLSTNGSYHFAPDAKVDPFVTAGYTLFFRNGVANGFNVGAGLNYWLRENVGLHLQFRDYIINEYDTAHFLGFRIGLAFR